jgi:hypothetical protein
LIKVFFTKAIKLDIVLKGNKKVAIEGDGQIISTAFSYEAQAERSAEAGE